VSLGFSCVRLGFSCVRLYPGAEADMRSLPPAATAMSDAAESASERDDVPSLGAIFLAFAGIAIVGFGGVIPWSRRMIVEQRRWLTPDEFTEVLSLSQFLPGGNIINLAVVLGARFRGPLGAVTAIVALMAAPMVLILLVGALYLRFQHEPRVEGALIGLSAAAVGLIAAMALKMLEPFVLGRALIPLAVAAATFIAVGVLRIPLPVAVFVLASVSIAVAWRRIP
jgi:chromate transporter